MKTDFPKRRRLLVCCVFCGARLYTLVGDYVRVLGVCRTCEYRELSDHGK